jgi:hypothetical protein
VDCELEAESVLLEIRSLEQEVPRESVRQFWGEGEQPSAAPRTANTNTDASDAGAAGREERALRPGG